MNTAESKQQTAADGPRYVERLVLPDDAHALRPVRFMPDDELRYYEGVTFPKNPRGGCDVHYRRCLTFGGVAKSKAEEAGLCDILDANGDIVADFPLNKKGLRYLCRTLNLSVQNVELSCEAEQQTKGTTTNEE